MKRTHNEDNFSIMEESGLYIVADGMGGHASGEIASKMAVDAMREFFAATANDPERTWPYKMDRSKGYEENRLITGIKLANLRIYESAQRDPRQRGMGTTIVSLFAVEDGVYIAHVGDSRVYRMREGNLEQLTEDHSLLNDYIKMKRLTPEEIANFPHKNVIVRALGMKDTVKVDTRLEQPRAGDVYLLCSDGLSGPVTDPDMAGHPARHERPEDGGVAAHREGATRTADRTTSPSSSPAGSRARARLARPSGRPSAPRREVGDGDEQQRDEGHEDVADRRLAGAPAVGEELPARARRMRRCTPLEQVGRVLGDDVGRRARA